MDSQIYLTELNIQENQQSIKKIQEEIESLGERIGELNSTLTQVSKTTTDKIRIMYKRQRHNPMFTALVSNDITTLLRSVQYLKRTQENDRDIILRLQNTKTNFNEKKSLREEKEVELNTLNDQLAVHQNSLRNQQKEKEVLLQQTQKDNYKYQTILAQALAERKAIEQALVSGTQVGPVKKGDSIALVGNSGYPFCSTGPHLHFEVQQNGLWVNAESYLTSKTLSVAISDREYADTTIGGGNWDWPLSDPIVINQRYGSTPWSYRYAYSGYIHTGVDMESKNSDVIRAVADGTLFISSQVCGDSVINIKYIDHGSGIMSFYLHVQ